MARGQLDGAGLAKMATLDEAQLIVQRLHGQVEQMAIAMRNGSGTAPLVQSIRRAATPLVTLLKSQFGGVSDVAAQFVLVASRGSMSEASRLRSLREGIASLRASLEGATTRVRVQHEVDDRPPAPPKATDTDSGK